MFRTFLAAAALMALLAACGEAGGEKPQPTPTEPATAAATPTAEPTATPTQPPDGAGGGGGEVTVVPVTPLPWPSPVPDDWATYTDQEGRFTFRYPPTWFFSEGGNLITWDPATWDKPWLPPNSIKVDTGYFAVAGGGTCGGHSVDPQTGKLTPRPGATPATLGGVSGWEGVTLFDPAEGGVSRSHGISVVHQGYCFQINAYFAQDEPDETTFWQIVNSFRFTDK